MCKNTVQHELASTEMFIASKFEYKLLAFYWFLIQVIVYNGIDNSKASILNPN